MNRINESSRMPKHLCYDEIRKSLTGMQEEDMAYLQDMSLLTGLPIKRLIDLYHPECAGNGRYQYGFWG